MIIPAVGIVKQFHGFRQNEQIPVFHMLRLLLLQKILVPHISSSTISQTNQQAIMLSKWSLHMAKESRIPMQEPTMANFINQG